MESQQIRLLGSLSLEECPAEARETVNSVIVLIATKSGVTETQSLRLGSLPPGKSIQLKPDRRQYMTYTICDVIVLIVGLCWLPGRGYVLAHITLLAKLAKSKASGARGLLNEYTML